jgi:DNA-binding transcriptional LysR family regulator
MDLEELRAFLHVVESGSFLAAAETLQVSRTTLQRRVGSLESRAGVPLLESTQRGVILTDAGRLLARRGRAFEEEADALLTSIRELGHEPSGVLRFALPVGLPPQFLAAMYGALRASYPRLHVASSFSDNPLAESLVGVDIAVHFGEPPTGMKWLSYVMLRMPVVLLASREYLARTGAPTSIEDLAGHELFAWQSPGEDARVWPLRKGGTFAASPALISSDIHALRHCCMAGLGMGLLPDAQLPDPALLADTLVPVLPDLVGRDCAIRVTVLEALSEVPKIKMVLDRIRAFVGET